MDQWPHKRSRLQEANSRVQFEWHFNQSDPSSTPPYASCYFCLPVSSGERVLHGQLGLGFAFIPVKRCLYLFWPRQFPVMSDICNLVESFNLHTDKIKVSWFKSLQFKVFFYLCLNVLNSIVARLIVSTIYVGWCKLSHFKIMWYKGRIFNFAKCDAKKLVRYFLPFLLNLFLG